MTTTQSFVKGQQVVVTRGNFKGQAGTVVTHTEGSAWFGIALANGANGDYRATALRAA